MDFKDLLGKLTQLNEAEMTSRKVAGKAYGGSAQDEDEDEEDGEKKAAAPAEKRGRGRPRKAGGEAQTKAGYGGAAELQKYIVGSVPKKSKELEKLGKTKHKLSDKEPTEKKKVKESLKDWIAELDMLAEAEQISMEPAKQNTQVIKQGNKVLGQVSNPQLAQQIKQSIGKGEMSLAGSELGEDADEYSAKKARAGKDIGKPGKQFSKIAKSAAERYGSKERGEKVAGAVLAKLRGKTNEADIPPNDSLASPLTLESRQGVAEGGIVKSIKRGMAGWGAFDKDKPADVVKRNKEYDTDTLKRLSNLGSTGKGSPAELQQKVIDRELKKRGEQGLAEGLTSGPTIKGNKIYYADHVVVLNPDIYSSEYMEDMASELSPDGNAKAHYQELKYMNNDGSWTVKKLKKDVTEAKNHMGETEYNTYAGWKAACRKAGADKFEGDRDICQAMKDGKGMGEWDGEKGSVYDDSHKKKKMAESKRLSEGKETSIKAAHHRGKAHALAREGYNCRYDEGSEEARMYHEGYKMGLDECYGVMPMRGVVVGEESDQEIVDDMASFGAMGEASFKKVKRIDYDSLEVDDDHTYISSGYYTDGTPLSDVDLAALNDDNDLVYGEIEKALGRKYQGDMEEGNAFTAALAKTPKGGEFSVGGKTFKDTSGYDAKVDEMMMAFEGWDKQLSSLLTEGDVVEEGMSVSVSKGQQGAPDSVSITASDSEADKLLSLVRQLGVFGGEEQASDYGSTPDTDSVQQHGDLTVVDDHDGMMALIKKVSGGDMPGMAADSTEDYADEMDSGMDHAMDHSHDETCNECGGMMEAGHSCGSDKEMVDEVESEDQMEFEVAEDNAPDSDEAETSADEESEAKEDEALAVKSISEEDEEDDEEEDGLEESFANSADDTFEADMDFMTRVISGGLNKQKSTGQTTIPVIPGQKDRMGVDGMNEGTSSLGDWKKLAGLK